MWTAVVNHMFLPGDGMQNAVLSDVQADPICQSPPGWEGWCSDSEVVGKTGRLRQCYSLEPVLFLPLSVGLQILSILLFSNKTLWPHVGRYYI